MILLTLLLFLVGADMKLTSQAFQEGEPIPSTYSCQGKNVSPPLSIAGVPKETKTLAIIMDDPDAPSGTFVHWVAWDISPQDLNWAEGKSLQHQGKNHMGKEGYFGPCPPPGKPHHYHFKIYALDTELKLAQGTTKDELLSNIKGHVLAQAELVGTYQRQ